MGILTLALVSVAYADGTCDAWRGAQEVGRVGGGDLDEASGIATSRGGPLLWSHNDRGDDATLHALGLDGAAIGRVPVLGATHTDWEDIAAGPCAAACSCLYVGDIGDNDGTRAEAVIWRVPEPSPVAEQTAPADALRFVYPDGPHDAEALLVDPITAEIYVVTRTIGPTGVYAIPVGGDEVATAELVATLDLSAFGGDAEVTAGDVSPSGDRVVLRTNGDLLLFEAAPGGGVRGALQAAPTPLPGPDSADGEAVAWSLDGRSLYLVDEGASAPLWEVRCATFADDGTAAPDCGADEEVDDGCGCGSGGAAGLLPLMFLWGRRRR